jgi:hypothetical protein
VNGVGYPTYLDPVEREVRDELERIHQKWGEQNHPDGTGPDVTFIVGKLDRDMAWLAGVFRGACDMANEAGCANWRLILLEEVFEAMAEEDPTALRAELIQVAAVAQQWVAAIDRRAAQTTEERK